MLSLIIIAGLLLFPQQGDPLDDLTTLSHASGNRAGEIEEELVSRGAALLPDLHALLPDLGPNGLLVAVRALGRIAGEDSFTPVASLLKRKKASPQLLRRVMETLFSIDAPRAVEKTLPLLGHREGAVRRAAFTFLEGKLRPEDLPYILSLTQARREDTRLRAVKLLKAFPQAEALEASLQALGDKVPAICLAAIEVVARHPGEEVLEILVSQCSENTFDRQWAYASLALAKRLEILPKSDLPTELIPIMQRQIRAEDAFVAGAAAVLLAQIGYYLPTEEESAFLDQEVPDALVRALARDSFYRDFSSLLPFAQKQLRMLSGEGEKDHSSAWASWWLMARKDFRANRSRFFFRTGLEENSSLVWERAGNRLETIQFRGPKAPRGQGDEEYLLDGLDMAGIWKLVEEARILGESSPDNLEEQASWDRLRIQLGSQKRMALLTPGQADGLQRRLLELRYNNLWQLFAPPGLETEFFRAESAWWATTTDADLREVRLKDLLLSSLEKSSGRRLDRSLRILAEHPTIAARMQDTDADRLLGIMLAEAKVTGKATRILRCLLLIPDPAVTARTAEAVLTRWGFSGKPLLVELFRSLENLDRYIQDSRPEIRSAAAEALAHRAVAPEASLLQLLADPHAEVRRSAAYAAGKLRLAGARDSLIQLAETGEKEVRADACLALGRIGGEGVLGFLIKKIGDPDASVREACVQGIVQIDEPKVAGVLAEFYLQNRIAGVGEAARRGILLRGGGMGLSSLKNRLQHEDPLLRRRAALLLADLLEAEALEPLLDLLEEGPEDPRLLQALATLTGQDFQEAEDSLLAYRQWHGLHGSASAVEWFWQAAARENLVPPVEATRLGKESIPLLIDLLRSRDWILRVQAGRWLSYLTGKSFGVVERFTPGREVERILSLYQEHLVSGMADAGK